MNIYQDPPKNEWPPLCERPKLELEFLESTVRNVLTRVKKSGDNALRELTQQFDKVTITSLEVTAGEITKATSSIHKELKTAIQTAADNIRKFHAAQRKEDIVLDTMEGVTCWRKAVPIERVGIYIPGGSAPLFSTVLMLAIPAALAGCKEIILCTPPGKNGDIDPAILFTANLVGATRIFRVGGAQAIAAMAYGTQTVPGVYKIFGPGNQYVTKAKQMVAEEGIAIDMPAGPSEVLVLADHTAVPSFVAADLLSQAEHGEDSQVMLVLMDPSLLPRITEQILIQLAALPRKEIAEKALTHSRTVLFNDLDKAIAFVNDYAPEHLILNLKDCETVLDKISNAGSVFIGNFSPEALGDYASGTNHTLPTNGYAKAFAGVSLDSFLKYITFQRITETGIRNIGPVVEKMAEAEQLMGHKKAVTIRLESLQSKHEK